jgi:hypothetical protein
MLSKSTPLCAAGDRNDVLAVLGSDYALSGRNTGLLGLHRLPISLIGSIAPQKLPREAAAGLAGEIALDRQHTTHTTGRC